MDASLHLAAITLLRLNAEGRMACSKQQQVGRQYS